MIKEEIRVGQGKFLFIQMNSGRLINIDVSRQPRLNSWGKCHEELWEDKAYTEEIVWYEYKEMVLSLTPWMGCSEGGTCPLPKNVPAKGLCGPR